MAYGGAPCAFCSASTPLVDTCVLDEKWSRAFGGDPAVALDHGWYRTASGPQPVGDQADSRKFFRPYLRALCDFCVHGWVEDVRWRAEPTLLALTQSAPPPPTVALDVVAAVRWAQLTAMLAELLEGMPTAATSEQRSAVRHGVSTSPPVSCWFFSLRQRLPARVHLSQVAVPIDGAVDGLVQVVSIDVAHLTAVVVLPSGDRAQEVVARSALTVELGQPAGGAPGSPLLLRPVDLARSPHPHKVAVQRLCATSSVVAH